MKISKILKSAVISLAIVAVVSAGVFASITDCIGKDTANAKYPGLVLKDITTNANVTAPNGFKVKCTTVKEKDASNNTKRYVIYGKTQADCSQAGSIAGNSGNCDSADLSMVVTTIINTIIFIVGMISVVMVILGGISYATSQGDPGKVKKGKDTILYGIIGLVISLLAFAIVNFVLDALQQ